MGFPAKEGGITYHVARFTQPHEARIALLVRPAQSNKAGSDTKDATVFVSLQEQGFARPMGPCLSVFSKGLPPEHFHALF
jgi:hypothetical protein